MASPTFFSDGHTPALRDTQWRIEQKILGALVDGGGGGMEVVAGAPTAGSNPTGKSFYWDSTNKNLYVWDGADWNAH